MSETNHDCPRQLSPSGLPIWLRPSILCVILGVLGVLPLTILTPPFQVPDEPQHFARAYQLSEFNIWGEPRGNAFGAVLPSSIPLLVERFLGTRENHVQRLTTSQPLSATMVELRRPLDVNIREFVDFSGTSFYGPLVYLPQTLAIIAGRAFNAGPLELLFLARVANAITAIAIISLALMVSPFGNSTIMVFAFLPTALYLYASVSPDAIIIASSTLYVALVTQANRTGWTSTTAIIAMLAGSIVCIVKPVYVPILFVGMAGAVEARRHHAAWRGHLIVAALTMATTIVWVITVAPDVSQQRAGTDVNRQLHFLLNNPMTFLHAVGFALIEGLPGQIASAIGRLGWANVSLPFLAYPLAATGIVASLSAHIENSRRLSLTDLTACFIICGVTYFLIVTSVYLYWNPVGSSVIEGLQGRYFLPLVGPVGMILASVPWTQIALRCVWTISLIAVSFCAMMDAFSNNYPPILGLLSVVAIFGASRLLIRISAQSSRQMASVALCTVCLALLTQATVISAYQVFR